MSMISDNSEKNFVDHAKPLDPPSFAQSELELSEGLPEGWSSRSLHTPGAPVYINNLTGEIQRERPVADAPQLTEWDTGFCSRFDRDERTGHIRRGNFYKVKKKTGWRSGWARNPRVYFIQSPDENLKGSEIMEIGKLSWDAIIFSGVSDIDVTCKSNGERGGRKIYTISGTIKDPVGGERDERWELITFDKEYRVWQDDGNGPRLKIINWLRAVRADLHQEYGNMQLWVKKSDFELLHRSDDVENLWKEKFTEKDCFNPNSDWVYQENKWGVPIYYEKRVKGSKYGKIIIRPKDEDVGWRAPDKPWIGIRGVRSEAQRPMDSSERNYRQALRAQPGAIGPVDAKQGAIFADGGGKRRKKTSKRKASKRKASRKKRKSKRKSSRKKTKRKSKR